MRRLTCISEREQGAVAMIVAMLFGFGVMIGLAALTIDVGNINADRRQLQNGADAVALAVAQQCVKDGTCDVVTPLKIENLQKLADANAADGATAIKRVDNQKPLDPATLLPATDPAYPAICGNMTGLYNCDPSWAQSMENLQECPSDPAPGVNYVRVYTETDMKKADGTHDNILPYYFGAALTGIRGANQQACASVALLSGYSPDDVVAVTDAVCAWNAATNSGTEFPDGPDYGVLDKNGNLLLNPVGSPAPGELQSAPKATPLGVVPVATKYVVKVLLQGAPNSSEEDATCGKNDTSSGQYTAGNFGWLKVKAGTQCTAVMNNDYTDTYGDTGGPPPGQCDVYLENKVGQIIYMPIFKKVVKTTSLTTYTLDGVSAFFLAGFQAPTAKKIKNAYATTGLTSYNYCLDKNVPHGPNADGGCLWGWFVDPYVPAGGTPSGGTPRGPIILGLNN